MSLRLERALFVALLVVGFAAHANALIVTDSTPTPGETGSFSDGLRDYFGVVDPGGATIGGIPFLPNETTPPAGSLAGRDHDDGNTKPQTRTGSWTVTLPAGSTVNSISFSGTLAAADGSGDGFTNWVMGAGDAGDIMYELFFDGASVDSESYLPPGGSSTNLEQVAAPMTTVTRSGIAVSLSDPGGFCAAACDIEVIVTAGSSSGEEDWWTTGTLSVDAVIPGGGLFTVDCNNNALDEPGTGVCNPGNTYDVPAPFGPVGDDYEFSFVGSTGIDNGLGAGVVKGAIRAVDVSVDPTALQATVAFYLDFGGAGPPLDFTAMDVLIFDVILDPGSAPIDEIAVSVGTNPTGLDPLGAGYFLGCATGGEIGCAHTETGGSGGDGQEPNPGLVHPAIRLVSGGGFLQPGAAYFSFDESNLSGGNLSAGETTRRLFVTYPDTGPDGTLSKLDQTVVFVISSGTNRDFFVEITDASDGLSASLGLAALGLLAMLGWRRLRRSPLLGLGVALLVAGGAAPQASAQPDVSLVGVVNEDNGFPGVCAAPCYQVQKQADVFLDGNPSSPGVCSAGTNTYVYTLTHVAGTLPFPNIPVTEFEVQVGFGTVASAGFIPGAGIAPTSTVVSPLNVVTWDFPDGAACPACLDQGKSSEQLFICSTGSPGFVPVSVTGVGLAAPEQCLGPLPTSEISLTPLLSLNEPGGDHTVTALVTEGTPLAGVEVAFQVLSGPNAGSSGDCSFNVDCTTDASGMVFFTYLGDGGPGVDQIAASFEDAVAGTVTSNTVLKFWDLDCNQNDVPDTCDIDENGFGGSCSEYPAAGGSTDTNNDGVPDDCNVPPDCTNAGAEPDELWPPNGAFRDVAIAGVTDEDGDPIAVTVTSIFQDEPVQGLGSGTSSPDATGVGTETASVRAERAGTPHVPGDGRVYHVSFDADDGAGGACSGTVTVCVPHDKKPGRVCVDEGPTFDSTDVGDGPHPRGPCGIGFELAFLLPPLLGLHGRRRKRTA